MRDVSATNAGINLFNDVGTASNEDWDWILGVNLGGVGNGVQTFVPRIKAQGRRERNAKARAAWPKL
jgi:NADP-dependent 3-hydroxy acid dehydrogenase YdfG